MREGSTAPLVKSLRRKSASHNNSSKVSATSTNSGSRMAWIDIMSFLSASTWRHLPALSKLNAERGFVVLVDEGGKPGFLVLQGGEAYLAALQDKKSWLTAFIDEDHETALIIKL